MPDTKSPIRGSARLTALKDAIKEERRVLGLDIDSTHARTEVLRGKASHETVPTGMDLDLTPLRRRPIPFVGSVEEVDTTAATPDEISSAGGRTRSSQAPAC